MSLLCIFCDTFSNFHGVYLYLAFKRKELVHITMNTSNVSYHVLRIPMFHITNWACLCIANKGVNLLLEMYSCIVSIEVTSVWKTG